MERGGRCLGDGFKGRFGRFLAYHVLEGLRAMSGGGVLDWGVRSCHDFYDPVFAMMEVVEKNELLSVRCKPGQREGEILTGEDERPEQVQDGGCV